MKLLFSLLLVCLIAYSRAQNSQIVNTNSDASGTPGEFRYALEHVTGNNPTITFDASLPTFFPGGSYPIPTGYTGSLTISFNGTTFDFSAINGVNALTFNASASLSGFTFTNTRGITVELTNGTFSLTNFVISNTTTTAVDLTNAASSLTVTGGSIFDIATTAINIGSTVPVTINVNQSSFGAAGLPNQAGIVSSIAVSGNIADSNFGLNTVNDLSLVVGALTISGNTFGGAAGPGSANSVVIGAIGTSVTLDSNNWSQNPGSPITFNSPTSGDFTISNNIFFNNTGIPINTNGALTPTGIDLIASNTFTSNGAGTGYAASFNADTQFVTIEGNTVTTSDTGAVAFAWQAGSFNTTITTDSSANGLTISGGLDGITVIGSASTWSVDSASISNVGIGLNFFGVSDNIQIGFLGANTFGPTTAQAIAFSNDCTTGCMVVNNNFNNVQTGVEFFGNIASATIDNNIFTTTVNAAIASTANVTNSDISGNTISGYGTIGIDLTTATTTTIQNNNLNGLNVASTVGINIVDATSVTISGNNITGNANEGILLQNTAVTTTIGPGNIISLNGGQGIVDTPATATITQNSIFSNGGSPAGIDVGAAGPTFTNPQLATSPQNAPTLNNATLSGSTLFLSGTFTTLASTGFNLEAFCSTPAAGSGEGQTFLGSAAFTSAATNPSSYNISIPAGSCVVGDTVTLTATQVVAGFTSEFSNAQPVVALVVAVSLSASPNASVNASGSASLNVSASATIPVSASATTPVSASATNGVSASATTPVSASATTPVSASATTPVSASATIPASASATIPASASATNPTQPPSPTPTQHCRNGVIDVSLGEECDFGAQTATFWRTHCCNIFDCTFRRPAAVCGQRPLGSNPRCVTAPRCSALGVCEVSRVKVGKKCANRRVCNRLGRCVRKPRR